MVSIMAAIARNQVQDVSEGVDKTPKQRGIPQAEDLMVLNKLYLLPYMRFDPVHCIECALPAAMVLGKR